MCHAPLRPDTSQLFPSSDKNQRRDHLWVLVIFTGMLVVSSAISKAPDDMHAVLKITLDSSFELSPKWQWMTCMLVSCELIADSSLNTTSQIMLS